MQLNCLRLPQDSWALLAVIKAKYQGGNVRDRLLKFLQEERFHRKKGMISQNILSWSTPTRIIESYSLVNVPYRDQTQNLGFISTRLWPTELISEFSFLNLNSVIFFLALWVFHKDLPVCWRDNQAWEGMAEGGIATCQPPFFFHIINSAALEETTPWLGVLLGKH